MQIDDQLLKRARKLAIDSDVSLTELIRRHLRELVERDEARRTIIADELDALFARSSAGTGGERPPRERLHER